MTSLICNVPNFKNNQIKFLSILILKQILYVWGGEIRLIFSWWSTTLLCRMPPRLMRKKKNPCQESNTILTAHFVVPCSTNQWQLHVGTISVNLASCGTWQAPWWWCASIPQPYFIYLFIYLVDFSLIYLFCLAAELWITTASVQCADLLSSSLHGILWTPYWKLWPSTLSPKAPTPTFPSLSCTCLESRKHHQVVVCERESSWFSFAFTDKIPHQPIEYHHRARQFDKEKQQLLFHLPLFALETVCFWNLFISQYAFVFCLLYSLCRSFFLACLWTCMYMSAATDFLFSIVWRTAERMCSHSRCCLFIYFLLLQQYLQYVLTYII